jgi:hypothetical protein
MNARYRRFCATPHQSHNQKTSALRACFAKGNMSGCSVRSKRSCNDGTLVARDATTVDRRRFLLKLQHFWSTQACFFPAQAGLREIGSVGLVRTV